MCNRERAMASGAPLETPSVVPISYSETQVNTLELSHEWTIKSFSRCTKKTLSSAKFPAGRDGDDSDALFDLRLFPDGNDDASKGFISLYLRLVSCKTPPPPLSINYKFFVLTKAKQHQHRVAYTTVKFNLNESFGSPKLVALKTLQDDAAQCLPDDSLTLGVELSLTLGEKTRLVDDCRSTGSEATSHPVGDDIGWLLESSALADLIVSTSTGEEIRAHKAILAARSLVFRAMLATHDTKEARSSRIVLNDIEPQVLRGLLYFVYTGSKPEGLAEMAEELLVAADKYDLGQLKALCEESICSIGMDSNNVCEHLVLADLCNAEKLRGRAISYFNRHAGAIVKTQSWKTLHAEHPRAFTEAICSSLSSDP